MPDVGLKPGQSSSRTGESGHQTLQKAERKAFKKIAHRPGGRLHSEDK